MSKEQLKKEFIKAYTDNRWKMPMTESLGKLFDVYYFKLQEKDKEIADLKDALDISEKCLTDMDNDRDAIIKGADKEIAELKTHIEKLYKQHSVL